MFLVPFLVGVAVLVVAVASRRDIDTAIRYAKAEEAADLMLEIRCADESPRNPLTEAFPQLRLWVPEQDAIYRQTYKLEGAAGPDIIIRSLSDAA